MSNQVYLSSTLDDLRPYRQAALEALRVAGFLAKDSYKATDRPTVEQCLKDVGACGIYVGLFAGRYGWQPDGHNGLSITELEYREAVRLGLRRFIFVRPLAEISGKDLDATYDDKDDADKRLKALRKELQDGKGHTCNLFSSPDDLALKLTQALHPPAEPSGIMSPEAPPHPNQLGTGLLIVNIRGVDEKPAKRIRDNLPASWQAGNLQFSPESPQLADETLALDEALARSRCASLLLTPASLQRLKENADAGETLARQLTDRLGCYSVLLDGLTLDDLPATWQKPAAGFPIGHWLAAETDTLGGELADLIQNFPDAAPEHLDVTNNRLVGLAYSVLAMVREEADAIATNPELIKDELGKRSYEFFTRLTGQLAHDWPKRYGPSRRDWQPFGNGSIRKLLDEVVATINQQTIVPKRDQTALLGNRIRLRHYPFDPKVFEPGAAGWKQLEAMRARGCLMLVDELSVLHPALHGKGDVFLTDPAVTVATLSGLDPMACSLDELIDSPQKIGALVDRFLNKLDPRCELSINNKARIRRWLRQAVPEALSGTEAQGADPDRRSQFRALAGRG